MRVCLCDGKDSRGERPRRVGLEGSRAGLDGTEEGLGLVSEFCEASSTMVRREQVVGGIEGDDVTSWFPEARTFTEDVISVAVLSTAWALQAISSCQPETQGIVHLEGVSVIT
jgi:hypothetical protein